jgi:hypothetical protein
VKKLLAAIFGVVLFTGLNTATEACAISDIQIKSANIVRQGSSGQFSIIVGELSNSCGDAIGVQLHITLRDRDGKVISTSDPWPAGIHNIPPRSTYAFTVNAAENRPADSVQVEVTEVRRW